MTEYYLKDLITQHPGGWSDVIEFVNKHFDRYKASYKAVEAQLDKQVIYQKSGDKVEKSWSATDTVSILPRLEEIHHPTSGIAAHMGWVILRALKLPLPGSKEWLQPCSKWKVEGG